MIENVKFSGENDSDIITFVQSIIAKYNFQEKENPKSSFTEQNNYIHSFAYNLSEENINKYSIELIKNTIEKHLNKFIKERKSGYNVISWRLKPQIKDNYLTFRLGFDV